MNAETTGRVTPRCYAARYKDCDGGATEREHWLTKALLKRTQFDGTGLQVDGLARQEGPVESDPDELFSRILCARHHDTLDGLDDAAIALYDAWMSAAAGKPIATSIQGERLERWALKVLVGMIVSGSVRIDGRRIKAEPPDAVLDVLFGNRDLPPPRGFHFVIHDERDDGYKVRIDRVPPNQGHELEGIALGITIQFAALRFMTTLLPLRADPKTFIYRPAGIDFGTVGRLDLRWEAGAANPDIPINISMTLGKKG